jgi:dihydrofolate reductase
MTKWTEQGTCPDGIDGPQVPALREEGTAEMPGIAGAMTTATDHPFAPILNAARKVVFSRTLTTADWASTTIAAGDTLDEIDKLRLGGDGHIVAWGGVSFWRSLMRLDLIDELQVSMYPYVAG